MHIPSQSSAPRSVFVVDYVHHTYQHEDFNRATISVLLSLCSIVKAYFVSSSTSVDLLYGMRVKYLPDTSKLRFRQLRTIPCVLNALRTFHFSTEAKDLIFLQLLPSHYLICSLYSLFLPKVNRIIVCVHGELAILLRKGFKNRVYGLFIIFSIWFVSFFKLPTVFVFLEKRILDNFLADHPWASSVSWIQHYVDRPFSVKSSQRDLNFSQPTQVFNIGSIGVHSSSKMSDKIYHLAEASSDSFKFFTCGLSDGTFSYIHGNVRHLFPGNIGDSYIPTANYFSTMINSLDAVVFFHEHSSGYRYICSGVVYDLVWLGIPALCGFNSPVIDYLSYFKLPIVPVDLDSCFDPSSDDSDEYLVNKLAFAKASSRITNDDLRRLSVDRWRNILRL